MVLHVDQMPSHALDDHDAYETAAYAAAAECPYGSQVDAAQLEELKANEYSD